MDMNFIRKAFLKVLVLERGPKENMRLKCSVVKFSVNRREGREGIPGRGTAGASALGQDSMWNVRCLAWLELLAEMSWELFGMMAMWPIALGSQPGWYFSITLSREEVQSLVDSNVTIQGENN